jgi:predicted dehydrogenase
MAHVFSVVGLNHAHIYGQTQGLLDTGKWRLKHVHAEETDLLKVFQERYPDATAAASVDDVLGDPEVELVASAAINAHRGPLAVRTLEAGKHFFVDKPCVTTLEHLEAVKSAVEATGRRWFAFFGEMVTDAAVEWVHDQVAKGNLGEPVHFMGLGPHTLRFASRPAWFWKADLYGGILNDIASHQMAQFIYWMLQDPVPQFSRVGNLHHPEVPEFEDFGDALVTGSKGATGYFRVDWFTPEGMPVFGDIRQQFITTEATVEHRKTIDIGAPEGHRAPRLIVTRKSSGPECVDLQDAKAPFFDRLTSDVEQGSETAIPFSLSYTASKTILELQRDAVALEPIPSA